MPFGSRTSQTAFFCLNRSSTCPTWISVGKPALNVGGGSKRTLGNMKRVVAVAAASIDAVNAAHASVIQEIKERRGTLAFFAGAAGAALAGAAGLAAGFGGCGGEGGAAVDVDSSLLIG